MNRRSSRGPCWSSSWAGPAPASGFRCIRFCGSTTKASPWALPDSGSSKGSSTCIGAVLILLLATLSREFIKAGPADLAQFQNLGTLLAEGRTWVGDVAALPAWCIGAYLYYSLFFKTRLVPRWLSVWGLAGITLTVAASILVLFRQIAPLSTVQMLMNLPIALQEMVLAIWLIVKGFNPSAIASPQR